MITRTYIVGESNTVRRRDNHTGPWIDVSIPIAPEGAGILYDVMTDPNNPDKVIAVGSMLGSGTNTGIMVSSNAGVTWTQAGGDWLRGKVANWFEVWWVDSNIIWVIGNSGECARSLDGGLTFDLTVQSPMNGTYNFTSAIHAISSQIVVVAGSTTVNPIVNNIVIAKTMDGGNTWVSLAGSPLVNTVGPGTVTGYPTAIWMSSDEQVIIVSSHYNQFRSTDGGATFTALPPEMSDSGQHMTWYPTYSPNVFWNTGGITVNLNKSSDSGITWSTIHAAESLIIQGAHFYTASQGYYVVGNQTFQTTDSGVTGTNTDNAPGIQKLYAVWTGSWPPEGTQPCGSCPEGYTYNPSTGLCDRIESTQPICFPTTYIAQAGNQNINYSQNGAKFYEDATGRPYPLIEVGAGINDNLGNALNQVGSSTLSPLWANGGSLTDGRLHAVGIWTNAGSNPVNEWIGFTACIEVPVDTTYCIGIAADNYVRFKIDGQLIYSATTGSVATFRDWKVIPITLTAGTHNIQLEGLNLASFATFGAEIYQADVPTLLAMSTPGELAAVTIFSTGDKTGSTFDLGEQSGCNCPQDYNLSICNDSLECVRLMSVPFEPCRCWLAINCQDSGDTVVIRFEDESFTPDLSLIYVLDIDLEKCYTIQEVTCQDQDENGEPDATIVIIIESYPTCEDCIGTCYVITDCESQESWIVENDALAGYVGKTIEVDLLVGNQLERRCLQITTTVCNESPVILAFNFIDCHDDCETCLPQPVSVPELVIRNRTVKPGWNTKGCPPAYVEKVSCNFAEAMYQEVVSLRYGIEFCCNEDAKKWIIKKEMLDLKALIDPEACLPVDQQCCPPCNLEAEIIIPCDPVTYLIGNIEIN